MDAIHKSIQDEFPFIYKKEEEEVHTMVDKKTIIFWKRINFEKKMHNYDNRTSTLYSYVKIARKMIDIFFVIN